MQKCVHKTGELERDACTHEEDLKSESRPRSSHIETHKVSRAQIRYRRRYSFDKTKKAERKTACISSFFLPLFFFFAAGFTFSNGAKAEMLFIPKFPQ